MNKEMYSIPKVNGDNLFTYFNKYRNQFLLVEDKEGRDLYSVKYMHMGVDWTLPYMLQARGIVIDSNGRILARPYDKFFNYGQLKNIPFIDNSIKHLSEWNYNEKFSVYDKLDGSLVVMFYYYLEDEVIFASSGSTSGYYSNMFKEEMLQRMSKSEYNYLKEVTKKYTLMAEFVSPNNKIVIDYSETDIILHGMRETYTGRIATREELVTVANKIGLNVAKRIDNLNNLEDVLKYIKTSKGIEGVVVVFESGKMLKLKTEEYFELHSTTNILNAQRPYSDKNIDDVIRYILLDELDDIIFQLNLLPFNDNLSLAVEKIQYLYFKEVEKAIKYINEFSLYIEIDNTGKINIAQKHLNNFITKDKENFLIYKSYIKDYNRYVSLANSTDDYLEDVLKGKKGFKDGSYIIEVLSDSMRNGELIEFNNIKYVGVIYLKTIKENVKKEIKKNVDKARWLD